MTPEERAELRRLADAWGELMTTGVNRLPEPAWWAEALRAAVPLAWAVPALLDEVERLRNCEPDPPPLTDESLRTELRGVYDALDRAMRERDAFRAWEREARAAMEMAPANHHAEDCDVCAKGESCETHGTAAGHRCTCYLAALRAVLTRKVGP